MPRIELDKKVIEELIAKGHIEERVQKELRKVAIRLYEKLGQPCLYDTFEREVGQHSCKAYCNAVDCWLDWLTREEEKK